MRPWIPLGLALLVPPALLAAAGPSRGGARPQDPDPPAPPGARPPQASPDVTDGTPVELGRVRWGRRLEPALEEAGRSGRPVLLLFQEVPG